MAKTTPYAKEQWDTMHNNGPFPLKTLYVTELAGETFIPSKTARYNDAAREIQRLIGETAAAGEGFRAYGSRWSLSHIAHQKDRMHYNGYMNLHIPLSPEDIHPTTSYDSANLFFFQCGNTIKELARVLQEHGKSLKTTGASNGQTIAGCVSTGVHGSAIDVGAIQDYVVGLNLITGPGDEENVYLERHTRPALSNQFAQKVNAKVIRNDGLFNAALVSLGGFGFIHGVVVEAEDIFLLNRYVRKFQKDIVLELAETMDFKNSEFRIEGETDAEDKGLRPHHFKVFMNPYTNDSHYMVEVMYKKPYKIPYPDPFPVIQTSVYRDLIYLFTRIAEKFPKSIPWLIRNLGKAALPEVNESSTGTHAETFWDSPYLGPAFACSFGVDHKDTSRTLDVLSRLARDEGPFPGIFGMRFIKRSEATLAFSRFPITCMIEIDGALWRKSRKLMSITEFSRRMIEVLKAAGIPFTIHWGKNSDWEFPGLIEHMYGEKAVAWRTYRSTLLSPVMSKVFSNDFLERTGLAERIDPVDEGLIASL
jgi:hypothetical protein